MRSRRRFWLLAIVLALVLAGSGLAVVLSSTVLTTGCAQPAVTPAAFTGAEVVANGSGDSGLTGWTADPGSGNSNVDLSVVDLTDSWPDHQAIDVQRAQGSSAHLRIRLSLGKPASPLVSGRSYRLQAYVRDVLGRNQSMTMELAQSTTDFPLQTPESSVSLGSKDDSWRLAHFTYTAASGFADDAVYFDFPPSDELHWQFTGVSIKELLPPQPDLHMQSQPIRVLSFAGKTGTAPDDAVWNYDVGGSGWGNDEVQSYTDKRANSSLDGNGNLTITARQQSIDGADGIARDYTSARLTTLGKVDIEPGSYVEANIRAATGTGVWPAFWLQGSNLGTVGWPSAGELDLMEVFGVKQSLVTNYIHVSRRGNARTDFPYGGDQHGGTTDLGMPADANSHLYGVYFDKEVVTFYLDRRPTLTLTATQALASGREWPFGNPMFLIVNVALGGLAGRPAAADLPATMTVGAIKIWKGQPTSAPAGC